MPARKTLVMFSSEFPPQVGGVATLASELSHQLAGAGHGTVVLLPGYRSAQAGHPEPVAGNLSLETVPLYRNEVAKPWWYVMYPPFLALYVLKAWKVVRRNRGSPILAMYWFPDGYVASLVSRRVGADYYVAAHGLDVLRSARSGRKHRRLVGVLSGARKVFCNSRFTLEQVADLGVPRDRLVTTGIGVDPDQYFPDPEGDAIRDRLRLGKRPMLFTLGRLVDRKGHSQVIEALPQVLEEFPDLVYVIGGRGPEQDALEQLARLLGVEKSVTFLGLIPQEELRAYYNACDIFVMPNHVGRNRWDVEGFGIVFLEAAACGKPVVGGDSGGAPDAIEDGATGFCVPPEDVQALRDRLLLLLRDRDLREQMGNAGRERVLRDFTWGRIAQVYAREMGLSDAVKP